MIFRAKKGCKNTPKTRKNVLFYPKNRVFAVILQVKNTYFQGFFTLLYSKRQYINMKKQAITLVLALSILMFLTLQTSAGFYDPHWTILRSDGLTGIVDYKITQETNTTWKVDYTHKDETTKQDLKDCFNDPIINKDKCDRLKEHPKLKDKESQVDEKIGKIKDIKPILEDNAKLTGKFDLTEDGSFTLELDDNKIHDALVSFGFGTTILTFNDTSTNKTVIWNTSGIRTNDLGILIPPNTSVSSAIFNVTGKNYALMTDANAWESGFSTLIHHSNHNDYDWDNDGDIDMMTFSMHSLNLQVMLHENIGNVTDPTWVSAVNATMTNGSVIPLINKDAGCSGDINNDSIRDIFIGDHAGGSFKVYVSNGSYGNNVWIRNSSFDISAGLRENPSCIIYDLDDDGDNDIIFATAKYGIPCYMENIGNASIPTWTSCVNTRYPKSGGELWNHELYDYDGDGIDDFFYCAENSVRYWKNLGTKANPIWDSEVNVGYIPDLVWCDIRFTDWDNDGDGDIIIFHIDGYIYAYENIDESYPTGFNLTIGTQPNFFANLGSFNTQNTTNDFSSELEAEALICTPNGDGNCTIYFNATTNSIGMVKFNALDIQYETTTTTTTSTTTTTTTTTIYVDTINNTISNLTVIFDSFYALFMALLFLIVGFLILMFLVDSFEIFNNLVSKKLRKK